METPLAAIMAVKLAVCLERLKKLLICMVLDVLGNLSFVLPGMGESMDSVYAPFQAYMLKKLFKSNAIALIGLVEEGLPFTDCIPTASVAWMLETFFMETTVARLLGLKAAHVEEGHDDEASAPAATDAAAGKQD